MKLHRGISRVQSTIVQVLALAMVFTGWCPPPQMAKAQTDISFSIGASVSHEDEAYVREGIALGRQYGELFGHGKSLTDLIVNVRNTSFQGNPGTAGFTSDGYMTIFSGSAVWQDLSAQRRVQVVVHEYFHVIELTWLADVSDEAPQWFIEGLAEYLSYDALIREGIFREQDVQDFFAWSVANSGVRLASQGLEPLENYEAFYETAGAYEIGYLAIDFLIPDGSRHQLTRFLSEVQAGRGWEQAFKRAFNKTVDEYYAEFSEALANVYAPSEMPEPFQGSDPQALDSPVRITSAPSEMEAGEQLLVLGKTKPHASCVFSITRQGKKADEVVATFADPSGQIFWLLSIPIEREPGPATVAVTCGADPDSIEIAIADQS